MEVSIRAKSEKTRQVQSNVYVLLIVFFDCNGVVYHEFLPQGRTVNKKLCLVVMRRLREAICQKSTEMWKNQSWILLHDNVPAHTSMLVCEYLPKNKTIIMPQPPYSSDLATADFFRFPKLKTLIKGKRFAMIEEIKSAFQNCFEDWKKR